MHGYTVTETKTILIIQTAPETDRGAPHAVPWLIWATTGLASSTSDPTFYNWDEIDVKEGAGARPGAMSPRRLEVERKVKGSLI